MLRFVTRLTLSGVCAGHAAQDACTSGAGTGGLCIK